MEAVYAPHSLCWAQLEPGPFAMRRSIFNAFPLEISFRAFNLGFKAEAGIAPGSAIIGVVADPRTRARWFGTHVDGSAVVASTSTIDVRTEGPGAFYQVGIDTGALTRNFPNVPDALSLLEHLNGVALAQDETHATLLRSVLLRFHSVIATTNAPALLPAFSPKVITGTLIPLLAATVESVDARPLGATKSLTRRLAAVRACEAYMRAHADATITLLDLSRISGMRSRSLINAFEAVTGFSPMDYLKRLRLNGVRRALHVADKTQTRIIDVATAWGFWHMGHFASDYRALFGEAPSETLLN